MIDVSYVRQKEALGLGHAVLRAQELVGDEPFAVILSDDVIDAETSLPAAIAGCLRVLRRAGGGADGSAARKHFGLRRGGCRAGGAQRRAATGCIASATWWRSRRPSEAPSNLAIIGRYVLTPEIFTSLEAIEPGSGGEIQLTDGLKHAAAQPADLRLSLRRHALRRRRQAGIPEGDGGVRAEAPRSGRGVPAIPEELCTL